MACYNIIIIILIITMGFFSPHMCLYVPLTWLNGKRVHTVSYCGVIIVNYVDRESGTGVSVLTLVALLISLKSTTASLSMPHSVPHWHFSLIRSFSMHQTPVQGFIHVHNSDHCHLCYQRKYIDFVISYSILWEYMEDTSSVIFGLPGNTFFYYCSRLRHGT